ncbi:hypothetical protein HYH03_008436 [Edaphochlamys debaryana]|uniref:Protein kinase domain-containing protein n=1 Tax=Edaphochlamys debaryana TaxID=47281 RepID=A0A836BY80_9CHLO|nr:hypothetical protein HYH03_008436 [Edaphochlamys debaryana]|eukprot:KAG2493300.1 hypothetical protein HYH03_008436 [Edaphochlamys debaryana]
MELLWSAAKASAFALGAIVGATHRTAQYPSISTGARQERRCYDGSSHSAVETRRGQEWRPSVENAAARRRDDSLDSACGASWSDTCTASTCSSGSPRSDRCSVQAPDSWEDWEEDQEEPCACAGQAPANTEEDTTQPASEPEPEPRQAPTGASPRSSPSPCAECTAVPECWENWTEEHDSLPEQECSSDPTGPAAELAEPVSGAAGAEVDAERATSAAGASTSDGAPSGLPLDAATYRYIADHGLEVMEFARDKCLGKGAFSRAYLVQVPLPDGSRVPAVLKRMRATTPPTIVAAEVDALSRLRGCAGCVQLLAHGEHEGRQALLLEYCSGGALDARLEKSASRQGLLPKRLLMREPALRALAVQLFTALANVHAAGLIHLDIKPDNLLYDNSGQLRLADFGTAAVRLDDGMYNTKGAGSLLYMAPEVEASMGHKPTHPITDKADVYSAGATLLEAAWPYGDVGRHWSFTHGSPITIPKYMPQSLVAFLQHLLHESPLQRPTAKEALENSWLCGCDE